jgi:hypothetical protein
LGARQEKALGSNLQNSIDMNIIVGQKRGQAMGKDNGVAKFGFMI